VDPPTMPLIISWCVMRNSVCPSWSIVASTHSIPWLWITAPANRPHRLEQYLLKHGKEGEKS
jgi:hypothetical protein